MAEVHIEDISFFPTPFPLLPPPSLLGVAPSVPLLLFSLRLNSFCCHYTLPPPSIYMLVRGVRKPRKIDPKPRVKAHLKKHRGYFFSCIGLVWGREC